MPAEASPGHRYRSGWFRQMTRSRQKSWLRLCMLVSRQLLSGLQPESEQNLDAERLDAGSLLAPPLATAPSLEDRFAISNSGTGYTRGFSTRGGLNGGSEGARYFREPAQGVVQHRRLESLRGADAARHGAGHRAHRRHSDVQPGRVRRRPAR